MVLLLETFVDEWGRIWFRVFLYFFPFVWWMPFIFVSPWFLCDSYGLMTFFVLLLDSYKYFWIENHVVKELSFLWLCLLISWSLLIGVFVVSPLLVALDLTFELQFQHTWFSSIFSIEVDMDVAVDDIRCCWRDNSALFLGHKGVVVTLSSDFFPLSPFEKEILKGMVNSMFFILKVKVMGGL